LPPVLCIGIDIGKNSHVAALLSSSLLQQYGNALRCPLLPFENSRAGFDRLLALLTQHASPQETHVLVEHTGHYGYVLEQYCQEHGITVYRIAVPTDKKRTRQKSDKRDARALAVMLYNQVVLQAQVADPAQRVHRLVTPNSTAVQLRGLVQHRMELKRETTRRKNKLIAIVDELFPELTQIYADPNKPNALALRLAFPTPQAIATASLDALYATRTHGRPGRKAFGTLQELARHTIGTKNPDRLKTIQLEQECLIRELILLDAHVDRITTEIERIVAASREGQILMSFIGISTVHAATLIAGMGSIANFESEARFRAYLGWSPHQAQSGTTHDTMSLSKGGNRTLKWTMYLVTIAAIKYDPTWKALYDRLVPRMCHYDERKDRYVGKMKVIGRVAGQIIGVIYTLLKRDHDLQEHWQVGGEGKDPPAPEVYTLKQHVMGRKDQHGDASRGKQAGG
jgi:transposase